MLNILDQLPRPSRTGEGPSALDVHRQIEAMKFAFADRGLLGDPMFANLTNVYPDILSIMHATACRLRINDTRTFEPSYYNITADAIDDHGTSHLSVIDEQGNAVALTTTVNFVFGSKILSPPTGVLLNNQMDDFSVDPLRPNGFGLVPSAANFVAPRKRPNSSMTPTIVLYANSTKPWFAVGGSGGPTIVTSVLQVILGLMDRGEPVRQLMDRPRLHHQLIPNVVRVEPGYNESIIAALTERGHVVSQIVGLLADGQALGVVQLVVRDEFTGTIQAASDVRKGGFASAFR